MRLLDSRCAIARSLEDKESEKKVATMQEEVIDGQKRVQELK